MVRRVGVCGLWLSCFQAAQSQSIMHRGMSSRTMSAGLGTADAMCARACARACACACLCTPLRASLFMDAPRSKRVSTTSTVSTPA